MKGEVAYRRLCREIMSLMIAIVEMLKNKRGISGIAITIFGGESIS